MRLNIMNYALWIMHCELWIENSELCIMNYELWIENSELWIMNYELKIVNCELWIMNCSYEACGVGRFELHGFARAGMVEEEPEGMQRQAVKRV